MTKRRIKVLLTKLGLDGHNWGILAVCLALRNAGMEVVYLGRHVTPDQIVRAAVEEDVDVVGLSSLSDAHRVLAPRVVSLLRQAGSGAPVVLGGFIQPEDTAELRKGGVAEVFGIQSKLDDIVAWMQRNVAVKN